MRLGQALDVLVAVPRQPDLDLVLAVLREGVVEQRLPPRVPSGSPSTCSSWVRSGGTPEGVAAGRRLGRPTASRLIFSAAGQVAVEQRRRQVADGDVVEAVAGLVGRQQRRRRRRRARAGRGWRSGTRCGSAAGWWPCGPGWDGRRPRDRAAFRGSGRSRRRWPRPAAPSVQPAASGARGACGRSSPTLPGHERRQERPARATTRPSSPRRHGSSHRYSSTRVRCGGEVDAGAGDCCA